MYEKFEESRGESWTIAKHIERFRWNENIFQRYENNDSEVR